MFKRLATGVILAMSLAATGAWAAEAIVTVKVDGVDLRIPLPEGMCAPTGNFVAAAEQTAALDTVNDTILTAFDCDLMSGKSTTIHYAILKRPKALRGQTIDRPALMAEYRADPVGFQKSLNAGANSDEVKEMLDPIMSDDAKVATGLKVAAADDDGVYISGVSRVQNGSSEMAAIALGMGMTAVKGKMLAWTVYAPGDSPAVVAEQLRVAKGAAKALVKAN